MTKFIARLILTVAVLAFHAPSARADSDLESKFQDMFVTAGYSAAAGAAIGAALLTFQDNPTKHLKFISVGASLGFLGGTAAGAWLVVAPVFVENSRPEATHFAANTTPGRVVIRPWIDTSKTNIAGIEAGAVFASF